MGGDGGTISSNRTYLRGAGKACHTADHPSNALKRAKLEDAEQSRWTLTTCAISGAVLNLSPKKKSGGGNSNSVCAVDIVACPYGKLYKHELVLEALLRRSQSGGGGEDDGEDDGNEVLGSHIRGMKDLHPVRFHVTAKSSSMAPSSAGGATNGGASSVPNNYIATCPITGSEIGSGNVPCFVIVRTKNKDKKKGASTSKEDDDDEVANNPNVLSERAIKEMGVSGLQTEYGPFDEENMIRLAPPKSGGVFDEIKQKWILRMEEERIAKLKKRKKDKKRKRGGGEDNGGDPKVSAIAKSLSSIPSSKNNGHSNNKGKSGVPTNNGKKSAVDEARSTVQSAVAHNPVLSNLFGTDKKKNGQSEKEKRVNLFTRNC